MQALLRKETPWVHPLESVLGRGNAPFGIHYGYDRQLKLIETHLRGAEALPCLELESDAKFSIKPDFSVQLRYDDIEAFPFKQQATLVLLGIAGEDLRIACQARIVIPQLFRMEDLAITIIAGLFAGSQSLQHALGAAKHSGGSEEELFRSVKVKKFEWRFEEQ